MSKLSIIIPHHNTPELLQRCLDSIPYHKDLDICVIDDNSSSEIVDFSHFPGSDREDVRVYFTKEGKGAGYARNVGLQHVKGGWLLFADSDDFFVPDFFRIVEKYFNEENFDMVLFKAKSVNSSTLEPSNRNENINSCIDKVLNGEITEKQASISVQSPWCRLIRHQFVKDNNIKFDEVIACNDTMFTTKCTCLAKNIIVSPEYLYVITHREGSLWDNRKTNPLNLLTRISVQIERNKYVKEYGFKQLPIIGYVCRSAKMGLKTFISALSLSIKKKALFQGIKSYYSK